eukprot:gnl/TRDRNA2_/TRDRNA2_165500_c0_seq4.p1 gnl/TRDRNA2_/TRDRNA2_165500_c0~~gnl/TRDRNA2_/TRDRNA2_165500_c0_seq4.p1  ORF type:complete len:219 (+),score=22.29 gnl/TRDRNA2_/TRDRNA2_165500_c0_seq4:121-777(+)
MGTNRTPAMHDVYKEVCIKNTFLHVVEDQPTQKGSRTRSKSESSLSASSTISADMQVCLVQSSISAPTSRSGTVTPDEFLKESGGPESDQDQEEHMEQQAVSQARILALQQQHDAGKCKPCLWQKYGGCLRSTECRFCHEPHPRSTTSRPSKTKRDAVRRRAKVSLAQQQEHQAQKADTETVFSTSNLSEARGSEVANNTDGMLTVRRPSAASCRVSL